MTSIFLWLQFRWLAPLNLTYGDFSCMDKYLHQNLSEQYLTMSQEILTLMCHSGIPNSIQCFMMMYAAIQLKFNSKLQRRFKFSTKPSNIATFDPQCKLRRFSGQKFLFLLQIESVKPKLWAQQVRFLLKYFATWCQINLNSTNWQHLVMTRNGGIS